MKSIPGCCYHFVSEQENFPLYFCIFHLWFNQIRTDAKKAVNILLHPTSQIIACSGLVQHNKVHFVQEDAAVVGILLGLGSEHHGMNHRMV